MKNHDLNSTYDFRVVSDLGRRDFLRYTAGTFAVMSMGTAVAGCNGSGDGAIVQSYAIDPSSVKTTVDRMLSFPYALASAAPKAGVMPNPANPAKSPNGGPALTWNKLDQVADYDKLGYGTWTFGAGLPIAPRTDVMADPAAYLAKVNAKQVVPKTKLLNFFAMTDIHITDKEAPNQLIALQQADPGFSGNNTSIYSPIMLSTTHVLDAAIQTANVLHTTKPFDFFISLGDACNSTLYNELRWYIDVIDGKLITPSSGAHRGADTIDYQKPYQAVGLDKSIPFYQTLGNHDHFFIGSFPVYESGIAASFINDAVWSVPFFLQPDTSAFPAMFSVNKMKNDTPRYYGGVIDGATPYGTVVYSGSVASYTTAPKVAADPNRRSLHRTEWIQEFFTTATTPVGHGFNLVSSNPNFNLVPASERDGFACYSFLPKSTVPLKVIVLDDTQREDDGSIDIHGHGFLDATRWAWLQKELADGQTANQLMIIAAHIPIAVVNIAGETEWWLGGRKGDPTKLLGDNSTSVQNAVDLAGLVAALQNTPNLLMWIAGHRHVNTVKAFVSPDRVNAPEKGFWQVETSSLHDWPQQFRTFEVSINSDYSVSIDVVNVDPAVADGTPAAKSRKYAIAAQQIVQNNITPNSSNYDFQPGTPIALPSMDPSRKQDSTPDPTIVYGDLSAQGVPYTASYNAQLFKQLSPQMVAVLKAKFPQTA